jgi:hypothetical protein
VEVPYHVTGRSETDRLLERQYIVDEPPMTIAHQKLAACFGLEGVDNRHTERRADKHSVRTAASW